MVNQMMINLTPKAAEISRATARAEKLNCRVEPLITEGFLFRVQSASIAGRWYVVEVVMVDGRVLGSCDCLAGQRGYVCHHLGAACQTLLASDQAIAEMLGHTNDSSGLTM